MELTHTQLWDKCLQIFRDNLSEEQYNAWFKGITCESYQNDELKIVVPSPYFVEHLEQRFLKLIAAVIRKVYGENVKLFYAFDQVGNDPSTGVTIKSANPSTKVKPDAKSTANPFQKQEVEDVDSQLNPKCTFENYCKGGSNQIARSIGEAIANDPKCKTFNPLFIYGPTGVGKTHLIQAIGIRIKESNPQSRVLYITARLFESQYTAAVCRKQVNEFINFYQSIDVLIIDDIQDLIGKTQTQNTFFHIFNHLHQNQKQLILTSDCCPAQMEGMEARLLSRFKWGMTAELSRPDYELRREVLTQKAQQDGLSIPTDVLEYIASNVTDSIRELEGIVVSLMAHSIVLKQDISIDLARNVLSNAVKISRKQINFEMITQEVCAYYKIEPDQLFTKSRKREISDARQMVMYMAKKHGKMLLTTIGTRLSRTHATVLYACKNIEERLPIEKQLQDDVAAIEKALLS